MPRNLFKHKITGQAGANGGGIAGGALLSVLPGGPSTAQIANPAGLTAANAVAISCARSTANYARTGTSGDPSNLVQNPENLAGAGWSSPGSATQNYGAAPDGTITASRFQNSGGNLFAGSQQQVLAARAPGGTWTNKTVTFSAYVKSNTGSNQAFSLWITEQGVNDYYSPDLVATSAWQRFSFTVTTSASAAPNVNFGLGVASALAGYDVQVWGMKAEVSASATTYVSPMLRLIPANTPRVEPEGLLVEGASTNLLLQSQAIATAPWSGSGAATAANAVAIAPDGTLTAGAITITSGSPGTMSWSQNIACAASTQYTFSVWLWVATGTANVRIARTNTATWTTATVSPTLTLTTTPTRYSLTYTTGASDTFSGLVLGSENLTPFTCSLGAFYAWNGQVEALPYASSPIPSTTVAVARPADVVSAPNPLAIAAPFSVSCSVQPVGGNSGAWTTAGVARRIMSGGGTGSANSFRIEFGSDSNVYFDVFDATLFKRTFAAQAFSNGTVHVLKGTGNLSGTNTLAYDGIVQTPTTSGAGTGVLSSQPATLYLGDPGSFQPNAWLSSITVSKQ